MIGQLLLALSAATVGGLVAYVRHRYLVVTVAGTSMLPTFRSGDRLIARRYRSGRGARPRRGDVVVIEPPARYGLRMPPTVKRVAALPGDPVPPDVRVAAGALGTVPPGSLVVLGDNAASTDSRTVGFYPETGLLAVVLRQLSRRASDEDVKAA